MDAPLEPTAVTCRVLLVEPNSALRSAIVDVLSSERFEVEPCESLNQVLGRSTTTEQTPQVVLVAWQSMDGLLADEHRHLLAELNRRLRLVLMVPRRWARMLAEADLGVAAMVTKPFDADELLQALRRASMRAVSLDETQRQPSSLA